MTKKKIPMSAIGEIVFDLGYLIFALSAGCIMLQSGGNSALSLYGAMTLVLGIGDCFHLIPRIYCLITDSMDKHTNALAFGKLITSISMTIFYVMLYLFWQLYYGLQAYTILHICIYLLAAVRILLCLLPQNRWFASKPSFSFAIIRNVPFVALGGIVAFLYAQIALQGAGAAFRFMPIAITISFIFYLIVVLCAVKRPKLGMMMLPKTIAYIWIISMGFVLL